MLSKAKHMVLAFSALALLGGCAKIVEKTIEDNPEIVLNVFKNNPSKFMDVLNEAARADQLERRKNAQKKEENDLEAQFKNPEKVTVAADRAVSGPKSAPVTIVEFSDFQCGYCAKAYRTIKQLKEEYKGKIRFVYKHYPVTGAPMSVPAAQIFEAIALHDADKAYAFHDTIFENSTKLRSGGEKYLKEVARDLLGSKADSILSKTKGDKVKDRLKSDREQAMSFDLQGTPAFAINGVFLKGAYPIEKFREVIDRHLKAKN